MAKYEICEPDKEHDLLATADDLIGLINEVLRLGYESGLRYSYERAAENQYYFAADSVCFEKWDIPDCSRSQFLTLTPPRRETMAEWRKRVWREVVNDDKITGTDAQYKLAILLSEMPEEG